MQESRVERAAVSLLEREREIERLAGALALACRGIGTLAVVEGQAGIGKTELLLAARERARAGGMTVLSARGSELEREFAFGVVRQLVEPVILTADRQRRAEVLSGVAALAAPLFAPGAPIAVAPAREQAAVIQHGLYWVFAGLASNQPLAVLVDDAHWADHASLRFLVYLAQRLEGLALALLVATRPAESAAEEAYLEPLLATPRAVVLTPRALSPAAVARLVGAALGAEPDGAFAGACHAMTGGVPFLVRELVRAVRGRRLRPVAASVRDLDDIGPETVARSVVRRARELGTGALELSRAVAVLAADAQSQRVIALADVDAGVAGGALDALAAAGLLRLGRPLEFAHPIVRAAVYGATPPMERRRLHARAARLLAADHVDDERIASHLLATEPAGDAHTVSLLLRTARRALARGAPDSAVSYLRRAVAEPPPAGAAADALDQLGIAEIHAGMLPAATEHLLEARRLAVDPPQRLRVARDLVASLSIQGRYREAAAVIGEVLGERDGLERDLVLALEGELLLLSLFEPGIRSDVEGRLGPLERDVRTPSAGARAWLSALTMDAALRLQPASEVRALAARARQAGILEELTSGAIAWNQVLFPLIFAEGFELAEQMLGEAMARLQSRASVVGSARAHAAAAHLGLRRGGLSEAVADATTSADAGRAASFIGVPIALSALVDALVERGEHDAAERAVHDAGMAREVPESFLHTWVLVSRSRLRAAQGRLDEAVRDGEEAARRADRFRLSNPATLGHRSALATALRQRGDRGGAARLAEVELALARGWGAPRALGIALRTSGLCQAGQERLELLRESVAALETSGARLELARSRVELGAATRRAGRRSEARELLHAGMELAHRCGAMPLAERAREELLATGARPRRIMRSGVDALTPSELRVTRLAAQGMTNREIAQTLFVAQRTVETHLTHVFRKLDVRSRSELPARLAVARDR